jgi:coenzyme PQQ synthesis protein D (PqqD)
VEERPIESSTLLRRTARAVHGDLPEETVVLDVEDGIAVRLNASGAWLWDRLERPATVDELAAGLAAEFDIDPERAEGDVVAFAREMQRRRLVEPA